MYKTAIAHLDNKLSYEDALQQFRVAYPEYEIRGVKQASNGWLAFIQKQAYQDNFPVEDVPAETETFSPGADDAEIDSMLEEVSEPSAEEYGEEEEKQEGLLSELEAAIDRVEQLVSEIKSSEDEEEEVRPFDVPEEDEEMDEGEGFEKEMPLTLEREKEAGVTFASAANEIEELVGTEYRGYRVASVKETKKSYVATLIKR
jgi:hypothetical protein